ncbi:MAG: hypothetical protein M1834_008781 [Cirrosporium novae-zelandiae]|nr:MAG: hypothetical protein M1834_008781 [Cirrosporium novae-zelandiae]
MWPIIVAFLALLNPVSGLEIPSFAPPSFAPSTIDNDGTHVARYDVRKTMAWLDPNPENLNSHVKNYFFIFWLTTVDGRKYHVTLAPNFYLSETTGIFSLNDLSNLIAIGATVFAPGTGSNETLNFRSTIKNLNSPAGSDNYTDLYLTTDYAGVTVDLHLTPTGKNLYIGGSGGVTLPSSENDFRTVVPG